MLTGRFGIVSILCFRLSVSSVATRSFEWRVVLTIMMLWYRLDMTWPWVGKRWVMGVALGGRLATRYFWLATVWVSFVPLVGQTMLTLLVTIVMAFPVRDVLRVVALTLCVRFVMMAMLV